ncbi:MAG: hypothetical protein ACRDIB_17775, partial [Ardenticatenaceae bacterium]
GYTSMERYLSGSTDEWLQELRDEVLNTAPADFHAFAGALERMNGYSHVVVMGSHENLKAANDTLQPPLELTRVL